ncbi:unnamed protein product [Nezara viridula]|uniref:Uncharacterized protein n=1 Tax=Nezara viridula TaxID=85310 RepID=A0A9P0HVE4_NEZVI|nr:unnamed protein product [Nezara viridula]
MERDLILRVSIPYYWVSLSISRWDGRKQCLEVHHYYSNGTCEAETTACERLQGVVWAFAQSRRGGVIISKYGSSHSCTLI